MNTLKGTVEATIQLTKANCYYRNHGICSLSLVQDFHLSPSERLAQNDLFYCPRQYKLLQSDAKRKPTVVTPCDCGHVQVLSAPQRACIAARKGLVLPVQISDKEPSRALCAVCGGQTTMHSKEDAGKRIVSITVQTEESK